jgi:hypothetical protein
MKILARCHRFVCLLALPLIFACPNLIFSMLQHIMNTIPRHLFVRELGFAQSFEKQRQVVRVVQVARWHFPHQVRLVAFVVAPADRDVAAQEILAEQGRLHILLFVDVESGGKRKSNLHNFYDSLCRSLWRRDDGGALLQALNGKRLHQPSLFVSFRMGDLKFYLEDGHNFEA